MLQKKYLLQSQVVTFLKLQILQPKQLKKLSRDIFVDISSKQISSISPKSISAIRPRILNSLDNDQITGFTSLQLRSFSAKQVKKASSDFINALSKTQLVAFRTGSRSSRFIEEGIQAELIQLLGNTQEQGFL